MKLSITALAAFLLGTTSANVVNLTPENYNAETAGKSVFIKFFAPWCGHCKSMADDWITLGESFADNTDILIGEVDCTNESNGAVELCNDNGIQGFPTLKFGHPLALEDYEGGRDLDSLDEFVKGNLGPQCGPSNLDLCDDESKSMIENFIKMSDSELSSLILEKEQLIQDAQETFEKGIEDLEKEYQEASEGAEATSIESQIIDAIMADREVIENLLKLSPEELQKKKDELESAAAQNELDMDDLVQKLQNTYLQLQDAFDASRNEIKKGGYSLMMMVKEHKASQNTEL